MIKDVFHIEEWNTEEPLIRMEYSVPTQIGIFPSLWKDHSLDNYGMQSMPEMKMSAMAPLHTHDSSGIVLVESTVNRNYTLGEFLNVWGLISMVKQ
jgi:hypothetical protein